MAPMMASPSPGATPSSDNAFDPTGIGWHFLSADGRAWLDQLPTAAHHVAYPVKTSVRRWVCRFPPGIYVKQVEYRGLRAIGKGLAGGNACREGEIYLQLAQRGIAVPEVLGYGSERRFGVLKRDVLITREVAAAQSFLQYMQDVYPTLESKSKRGLASDLAAFVRHLHDQGVIQSDLHIGNLLLRHTSGVRRFVLLDAQRVSIRSRGLSLSERLMNLAVLLCSVWRLASTMQCLRFLRDYGLSWNDTRDRSSVFDIKRLALRFSRRSWDAHARRALGSNARFIAERRDGFKIHRLRRDDVENLLDTLLPDPGRFFDQGEPDNHGHSLKVVRISFGGRRYSLKRYHDQSWPAQLGNVWRRSRAQRTWLNAWAMRMRHLPVPEPLICMDKRCLRRRHRSYLITEAVDDAPPLSDCWQEFNATQRRDTLICLGMELGRLHRFGGIHGDLTWNNLLVTFVGDHPRLTLVELDAGRMIPAASPYRCLLDIRVFLRDLHDRDPDGRYREFFLETYNRWR
jgi:tRNA A-37 threonylcarbamoyl transferase component Bud32